MYEQIEYDVTDPVATITLNRPEALNAWTGAMGKEVDDALSRAASDRRVVGIVITGRGRAFCAGADMNTLDDLSSAGSGASSEDGDGASGDLIAAAGGQEPTDQDGEFTGQFPFLLTIDKPIIAAVNGAVAGMAYPFSLCCDMRIGTPNSLFLTAFAQRGLIAEWGLSFLLPRLVGPAVALDLLMSSRRVTGEEARSLGLLNEVVEPDELLPWCNEYITNLAQRCSPASIAVMKRQVYTELYVGLGAAERHAGQLMGESFGRPDFREGVTSFLEKRAPEFARIGDD
ncbi:MAG: enoyl-CoA hydratase-related protein [Ilumatobacter sp.]|uniref:enoyl-CoA hydratase-related protein n=1 Tax=Ilumatobacter sp. TaxID=1967498 RepID=UPI003299389B